MHIHIHTICTLLIAAERFINIKNFFFSIFRQLKPDSHKNKKYKTGVKWRTLNPIYREEFYFESSPHDLNKQTLFITVWDKDIGKSNDFLGSLVIGYNSKGERLQQWLDCIKLPDHFHEKWHCLSGEHPTH